jgi:hypothetical protein
MSKAIRIIAVKGANCKVLNARRALNRRGAGQTASIAD